MTNHTKAFIALSVAVVVTYLSVRFLLPLVTPFVMAVFLAILIDPVVSFAHRKLRMPRGLAVFLALIVVSGLLITALSLSVAEIAHEIDQLSRNVGGLSAAITKAIESLFSRAVLFVEGLPQPIASYISEQQRTIVTFLESAVATVGGWLALFPSFVLMMLISLLATFFISKDFYQFSEGMFESIPLRWRHRLGRVRTELLTGFVRYLRSRIVLVAITVVANLIGLSLVRTNYAWLLALGCGLLDLLPMIGPSAIYLPWIGYHIIMKNYGYAVGLLVIHVIALAVRQVAELRIMQKNLDLHPLVTLLALYMGSKLFGAVGLVAGPLSVIFLKAVYQSVILPMFPVEDEE
ncbi:MAG: sporulation integral membrane protein YtvI [Bacillota bacterium]